MPSDFKNYCKTWIIKINTILVYKQSYWSIDQDREARENPTQLWLLDILQGN